MSREIKDLINSVEEHDQMRSQLELTVESLRNEIEHLTFRNREQSMLISELKEQLSRKSHEDIPEDIQILKEMVLTQRKELLKKDKDIDILRDKIENIEITNRKNIEAETKESEELLNANKIIINLAEENELFKNEIVALKTQAQEIQLLSLKYRDLQKQLKQSSNEKFLSFKKKNDDLRKKVDEIKQMVQTVDKNFKDLGFMDILKDLTKENQLLNKKLLMKKEAKSEEIKFYKSSTMEFTNLPKYYQLSLFYNIFALLSNNHKELIIDFLIQDLKGNNGDIKRFAIKILSEMKHKKAYDALLEMLQDKDWVIRYSLVKALKKFKNKDVKKKFGELLNDPDVDVREAALEALKDN